MICKIVNIKTKTVYEVYHIFRDEGEIYYWVWDNAHNKFCSVRNSLNIKKVREGEVY